MTRIRRIYYIKISEYPFYPFYPCSNPLGLRKHESSGGDSIKQEIHIPDKGCGFLFM